LILLAFETSYILEDITASPSQNDLYVVGIISENEHYMIDATLRVAYNTTV
jgi:hypothetical protein